jgi:nucleotide-binding universal stress UspA family protein
MDPTSSRPVLLACDLGETARVVVEAGLSVAERLGAPPVVVHVDPHAHLFSETFHAVDEEQMRRMKAAYRGHAATALRRMVDEIRHSQERVETVVREGRPYEVLLAEAREREARAMVMGARLRRGVDRLLLGRNAVRVVRAGVCPVFTVDVHRSWQGIARILYATDLREPAVAAQEWAARFAGAFAAEVVVLHVSELGPELAGPYTLLPRSLEETRTLLEARLKDICQQISSQVSSPSAIAVRWRLVVAADAAGAIVEAAREERTDLIVIGTHSRRGAARTLLGGVAEGVLHRAGACVLAVPTSGS